MIDLGKRLLKEQGYNSDDDSQVRYGMEKKFSIINN